MHLQPGMQFKKWLEAECAACILSRAEMKMGPKFFSCFSFPTLLSWMKGLLGVEQVPLSRGLISQPYWTGQRAFPWAAVPGGEAGATCPTFRHGRTLQCTHMAGFRGCWVPFLLGSLIFSPPPLPTCTG